MGNMMKNTLNKLTFFFHLIIIFNAFMSMILISFELFLIAVILNCITIALVVSLLFYNFRNINPINNKKIGKCDKCLREEVKVNNNGLCRLCALFPTISPEEWRNYYLSQEKIENALNKIKNGEKNE